MLHGIKGFNNIGRFQNTFFFFFKATLGASLHRP